MTDTALVFFADAGPQVGSGHVLRSLAVFDAVLNLGEPAVFLTPEMPPSRRGPETGIRIIEPDIESISHAISGCRPGIAVVDSYRHVHELVERGTAAKVWAAFDDHYAPPTDLALIINGSPAATGERYPDREGCDLLLGPAFAAISTVFRRARKSHHVRANPTRVLAALGGRDTEGHLNDLIEALDRALPPDVEIAVVGDADALPASGRIRPLGWLDQEALAAFMATCDLAVLSGGSMVGQSACIGLPIIAWPQVPNQLKHARVWEREGIVAVCETLDDLPAALERLNPAEPRHAMHQAGRDRVDGRGAERIADHLIKLAAR